MNIHDEINKAAYVLTFVLCAVFSCFFIWVLGNTFCELWTLAGYAISGNIVWHSFSVLDTICAYIIFAMDLLIIDTQTLPEKDSDYQFFMNASRVCFFAARFAEVLLLVFFVGITPIRVPGSMQEHLSTFAFYAFITIMFDQLTTSLTSIDLSEFKT